MLSFDHIRTHTHTHHHIEASNQTNDYICWHNIREDTIYMCKKQSIRCYCLSHVMHDTFAITQIFSYLSNETNDNVIDKIIELFQQTDYKMLYTIRLPVDFSTLSLHFHSFIYSFYSCNRLCQMAYFIPVIDESGEQRTNG